MPPRKKAYTAPARPLPPPNDEHPCAALLPAALAPSGFPARPHSSSYHCFLTSPFYPDPPSPSPSKKRRKAEPTLPPALVGALEAEVVQRKLLEWFDGVKGARGMPWRKEVDLAALREAERTQRGYEVWVSEIMLQQTRVDTVIPYWHKWMEAFPTVKDLAAADIEEVNRVWQGLGYYSRAKRLLDGARTVMNQHEGVLPSTADGLLTIDGIGPYSAGAISSIAFGQRSAMVDGNVIRVLSRLAALHAPDKAKSTAGFIWAFADVLVPPQPKKRKSASDGGMGGGLNRPGAWNQGLMELGATVCTPKNPSCHDCPLSDECLAYAEARYVAHRPTASSAAPTPTEPDIEDLCTLCSPLPYESAAEARAHSVEVYPMAKSKTKKREEDTAVCVVEWVSSAEVKGDEGRKVLLVKRPEKGLLAGLYEFPAIDLPPSSSHSVKSRTKLLDALLPTLLDLPISALSLSPSPSRTDNASPQFVSRAALPPVTQIYSHITRTYYAERLVLCSPTPPAVHPAPASAPGPKRKTRRDDDDDEAELVQSLPGRAKWVAAADVPTANIGGAVGKVWEERGRAASGRGRVAGGGEEGKKAAKKAGKVERKGTAKVEKGQGSLMGFFARKDAAVAVPAAVQRRADEVVLEASDDEVIVVEDAAIATVMGEEELGAAVVEEKKVYKKRRIAPASDEEEEEE